MKLKEQEMLILFTIDFTIVSVWIFRLLKFELQLPTRIRVNLSLITFSIFLLFILTQILVDYGIAIYLISFDSLSVNTWCI